MSGNPSGQGDLPEGTRTYSWITNVWGHLDPNIIDVDNLTILPGRRHHTTLNNYVQKVSASAQLEQESPPCARMQHLKYSHHPGP